MTRSVSILENDGNGFGYSIGEIIKSLTTIRSDIHVTLTLDQGIVDTIYQAIDFLSDVGRAMRAQLAEAPTPTPTPKQFMDAIVSHRVIHGCSERGKCDILRELQEQYDLAMTEFARTSES